MEEHVVIGLSGGVDSAVAAWLLKQQGYTVSGLFMRNWTDTTGLKSGACSYEDDVLFARMVAQKIGIPFHEVDLSQPYKERVVDYLFREYEAGRTPNPDVLCNREIKFDVFTDEALKLGAHYVATGHYCRKGQTERNGQVIHRLLAGKDRNKDQSYFLCQLDQPQLSTALFPLGELTKPEVREIATRERLPNADRKDSQGICFVGKVDLPTFLQQQLEPKEGQIIEIPKDIDYDFGNTIQEWVEPYRLKPEMGHVTGSHRGAHFYTIGQRKGLNIGGKKEPLFILGTDTQENIVYVGQGQDHPLLSKKALRIGSEDVHWIRPDLALKPGDEQELLVRIRYRQDLFKATLFCQADGIHILFSQSQRAVVPGQFAAWYDGDELLGSGVIGG